MADVSSNTALDDLRARHRKEQRDLQSKVTQKKKSANKKTRKGVNDECVALEKELAERHARELAASSSADPASKNAAAVIDDDADGETILIANVNQDEDDLLSSIVNETSSSALTKQTEQLQLSAAETTKLSQADEVSGKTPKQNRQKQRLARRAAEQDALVAKAKEEAANMPDAKQIERNSMLDEFKKRDLNEHVVAANGHCMYLAFADQLHELGLDVTKYKGAKSESGSSAQSTRKPHEHARQAAASFISTNPDDFSPFLEEPLQEYVSKIRDTAEWGGHLELMALAKAYNITVNVLQANGRVEKIESSDTSVTNDVWLGYYRHGFGLGEHYNSLRKGKQEDKPN